MVRQLPHHMTVAHFSTQAAAMALPTPIRHEQTGVQGGTGDFAAYAHQMPSQLTANFLSTVTRSNIRPCQSNFKKLICIGTPQSPSAAGRAIKQPKPGHAPSPDRFQRIAPANIGPPPNPGTDAAETDTERPKLLMG